MSLGTSSEIEKKRKRMELNRESARRSRLKKQKRVQDLTNEIAKLKKQILEGDKRCNDMIQKLPVILSENESLKSEKETLGHYLGKLLFLYSSFSWKKQIGRSSNQQWQETGPQKSTITIGMSKSLDLLF